MIIRIFFLFFVLFNFVKGQTTNESESLVENGKASFYHDNFQGQETSNGENYNKNDFTAAHRTFPFNTFLLVTNKINNKSVVVRINDRGPFKKSRVIDLTRSAATKIGMVPFGVVPVRLEVLTYLDRLSITDSVFQDGEIWDCYANKIALKNLTIKIWQTEYWKHAFYMASILTLETKYDSIAVQVKTNGENKFYTVIATGITSIKEKDKWIYSFRKMGFMFTKKLK